MRNQYKVLSEKYSKIKESSQSNGNQELIDYIEDITGNDIDLATDSIRDDGDRSCQAFGWYIVNTTGKKLFVMEKLRHRGSPFKERLTHDNMQNYISDQIFTHIAVNYNGKLEDLKGTKNKDGYYEHSIEELVIGNSPMLGRIGRIGSLQVMSWWNTIESVLPYLDKTLKLAKNNRTIDLNSLVICTVNYVDYYKNIKQQGEARGKTNPRAALARQYHLETDPIKKKQLAQQLGIVPQTPDKPRMQVTGDSVINEDVREESKIVAKARTLTKVLSEKYELQVEVPIARAEKAIYNTKALTKDFLPKAINIYKTQVEPQIKSWPDFDSMVNKDFSHSILRDPRSAQAYVIRLASWAHNYIYGDEPLYFSRVNIDGVLERWFVFHLYHFLFEPDSDAHPLNYNKPEVNYWVTPQKNNKDFIQSIIDQAVSKMKYDYDRDLDQAVKSGALANWKAAQEIHKKTSDITGIDTSGLVEANDSQDPEEVAEQIINRAKVATQGYIKLLNNRRVPGIKLAEYVRQHIQPIIQEILSYVNEKNSHKKAQLENYLKELLTTTWLTVDRVYWDVEMDTIVRGAVEDGEAIIQDLQQMADRGNKQINNL